MYKLNFTQYPKVENIEISNIFSFDTLKNNEEIDSLIDKFKARFAFNSLDTFSFNEDGFLALMLKLKGKIIVSKGESQAIVDAALKYKELGFDIEFVSLKKDGTLNYDEIKKCDYAFVSSYIMDTFVKVDLKKVKNLSKAKIISNVSATLNTEDCDLAIFDAYKLTGFSFSSIILHNELFEESYLGAFDTVCLCEISKAIDNFKVENSCKDKFKKALEEELKDDIYYFVDNDKTLEYTLHIGLKGIKARELIRTLALNEIFLTNGEGCSLGLAKPSRIIQEMGYEQSQSRWALSFSFCEKLSSEDISYIVKTIAKKYKQIKRLSS